MKINWKARAQEWCCLYAKTRDQRDRLRKKLRQFKNRKPHSALSAPAHQEKQ